LGEIRVSADALEKKKKIGRGGRVLGLTEVIGIMR
jgi:hypothetical protein